jgi:DNA-binding IclR family transcriptional regulator
MADGAQRVTPGVSSPRRALQILLGFDTERPRTTVAELAARFGLPTSSVYRYVSLFRELDLLEEDEETSALQLTPRILSVATAALAVQDYVKLAQPLLDDLCAEVGETVMLMRHSGSAAVCVASAVSAHALRLDFGIGHAFAFGPGATARIMLAQMSEVARAEHLEALFAGESGGDGARAVVEQQIRDAEERGWATSEAELEPGVWACSARVSLERVPPIAVTVAGPVFRLSTRQRKDAVAAICGTARAIEDGWRLATPQAALRATRHA